MSVNFESTSERPQQHILSSTHVLTSAHATAIASLNGVATATLTNRYEILVTAGREFDKTSLEFVVREYLKTQAIQ